MSTPRAESLEESDFFADRDDELTLLRNLVTRLVAGVGSAVLIEGEQGIGKSALLRRVLGDAEGAGFRLSWGTTDELGQQRIEALAPDAARERDVTGDLTICAPGGSDPMGPRIA